MCDEKERIERKKKKKVNQGIFYNLVKAGNWIIFVKLDFTLLPL